MKLLTKEILKKLPKPGTTEKMDRSEIKIITKFFTPDGSATWYIIEYDGEDMLYCYADLGFGTPEFGYTSLHEIEMVKGHMGLPIERDKFWNSNTTLEDVMLNKKS